MVHDLPAEAGRRPPARGEPLGGPGHCAAKPAEGEVSGAACLFISGTDEDIGVQIGVTIGESGLSRDQARLIGANTGADGDIARERRGRVEKDAEGEASAA